MAGVRSFRRSKVHEQEWINDFAIVRWSSSTLRQRAKTAFAVKGEISRSGGRAGTGDRAVHLEISLECDLVLESATANDQKIIIQFPLVKIFLFQPDGLSKFVATSSPELLELAPVSASGERSP